MPTPSPHEDVPPRDRSQAAPPDPQPEDTPGLEPGGGVAPGDTPPGESSTSGNTFREPDLPSEGVNKAFAIGLVLLVVIVAVLLFWRVL